MIIGATHVDFRTILGAISVFTLLGLLFAFLYVFFSRWTHSDFFTGVHHAPVSDYLFFSYTTLTTTGYGNLVPAGTVGQSFAVLEMLVGQFFLVTLVAGLVSLWRPGRARPGRSRRQAAADRRSAAPNRTVGGTETSRSFYGWVSFRPGLHSSRRPGAADPHDLRRSHHHGQENLSPVRRVLCRRSGRRS